MRLIDADTLMESLNPKESVWVGLVLSELIANAPTVDAIPVVRCKDCKHCSFDRYADGNVPNYACIEMDCGVEADGFCAWGERRENETN